MSTMIGKYEEPRCPNCKSKHCVGKFDYLDPELNSTCPFDGPADRAAVMSEFTFFDVSYNVVAINCCECSMSAYAREAYHVLLGGDFEETINARFHDMGWVMVDGFPVCPNCKGQNV